MINIYAYRIEGLTPIGETIEDSILNEIYSIDQTASSEDIADINIQNMLDEFSSKV